MPQRLRICLPMQETQEQWVQSLGQEDPLEKEMTTTPVFLLKNSMDSETGWVTVHGVTKSQTLLSD